MTQRDYGPPEPATKSFFFWVIIFMTDCFFFECHVRGSMGDQSTVSFMPTSARLPWVASSWDSAVVGSEPRPQGIQNGALTTAPSGWDSLSLSWYKLDWLQQTWTGPPNSCEVAGAGLLKAGASNILKPKPSKKNSLRFVKLRVCDGGFVIPSPYPLGLIAGH